MSVLNIDVFYKNEIIIREEEKKMEGLCLYANTIKINKKTTGNF